MQIPPPAGYSGTPLVKKLGIKPGYRMAVLNAPVPYPQLVPDIPEETELVAFPETDLDLIHFFTDRREELITQAPGLILSLKPDGAIWVSWPKKSSKVPTDITEDTVREVLLPLGLVDIKVCAVDATWSALKMVIRKENRKSS